ncbi:hypothetical protein WA026_005642 [Henosepilachna vigintioctopunctata]|uniref:Uncharacterized protein n=1 Tax=Henosepilachna vigintioctopunctata TaxID=420089 RepID=A0AAW1U1R2_9CUCU
MAYYFLRQLQRAIASFNPPIKNSNYSHAKNQLQSRIPLHINPFEGYDPSIVGYMPGIYDTIEINQKEINRPPPRYPDPYTHIHAGNFVEMSHLLILPYRDHRGEENENRILRFANQNIRRKPHLCTIKNPRCHKGHRKHEEPHISITILFQDGNGYHCLLPNYRYFYTVTQRNWSCYENSMTASSKT